MAFIAVCSQTARARVKHRHQCKLPELHDRREHEESEEGTAAAPTLKVHRCTLQERHARQEHVESKVHRNTHPKRSMAPNMRLLGSVKPTLAQVHSRQAQ